MKVDKKTLEEISQWFNSNDLSSATIEISSKGDFKITLSKDVPKHDFSHHHIASPSFSHHTLKAAADPEQAGDPSEDISSEEQKDTQVVVAPIVGTFYRSPSNHSPPFVQVGDKVKKGDIICILEAMKVMNDFEAEYDMKIVSVLVENSHLVEYGQALFEVKPL